MTIIEKTKTNISIPVLINITITEFDYEGLKSIRKYFGEHDKTGLEQLAYSVLDRVIKQHTND